MNAQSEKPHGLPSILVCLLDRVWHVRLSDLPTSQCAHPPPLSAIEAKVKHH